jgi:hypothetical protein
LKQDIEVLARDKERANAKHYLRYREHEGRYVRELGELESLLKSQLVIRAGGHALILPFLTRTSVGGIGESSSLASRVLISLSRNHLSDTLSDGDVRADAKADHPPRHVGDETQ